MSAERKPIDIPPGGAIDSVLKGVFQSTLQNPAVEIAAKVFLEARGLEGDWELRFTGARFYPVDPQPPPKAEEWPGQTELRERVAASQNGG